MEYNSKWFSGSVDRNVISSFGINTKGIKTEKPRIIHFIIYDKRLLKTGNEKKKKLKSEFVNQILK